MDKKFIKDFMKKYKITKKELAKYAGYSHTQLVIILKSGDKLSTRQYTSILVGMKNLLDAKIYQHTDALEVWADILNKKINKERQ
jgi:hypothetical protein